MTSQVSKAGMSAERFVEYIQNCYNDRFHEDMKRTMVAYLFGYDPAFLACLARIVILRHPRQYRTAPGPAELERYMEEAQQEYVKLPQDLSRTAIEDNTGEPLDRVDMADELQNLIAKLCDKRYT